MWRNRGGAVQRLPLFLVVLLALMWAGAGIGESPASAALLKNGVKPGNRSAMHIVRPPSRGARKRIRAPGAAAPAPARPRGRQAHGWFWKAHAPTGRVAAATRWQGVLATFATRHGAGKRLTSTDTLDAIRAAYGRQIRAAARKHRVSEALLAAVIVVESAGQPGAVSPKGAQGLMQLIPATAKRFGVTQPFNAAQNIDGGAAYLSWLLTRFDGDVLHALAGYNAGEGAVAKYKGVPPYRETRDYVVKVMDAVTLARTACATPPGGPRAPCDWVQ